MNARTRYLLYIMLYWPLVVSLLPMILVVSAGEGVWRGTKTYLREVREMQPVDWSKI